jgi:dihydroneopterin aldolase
VSDVILLEGIQIPAALGVTAAERRVRRPVTLDLEVGLDLREAGRVDRIGRTAHYKRIFEVVEDVAASQEHQLVEALGDRIARAVLSKFDVSISSRSRSESPPPSLGFSNTRVCGSREPAKMSAESC